MTISRNRRGALAMSAGMVCFVANDSIIKHVSLEMETGPIILIRGLFAILLIALACRIYGGITFNSKNLSLAMHPWVLLRSLLDAGATLTYLSALRHLPLANATAINMAAPLLIALMTVFLYKTSIHWRHWLIISAGFIGVICIIQPQTEGFNHWAWICLAGTSLHALRDLCMPKIPNKIPSLLITLSTATIATVIAAFWSFSDHQTVDAAQLLWLLIAAALLSMGYWLLIISTRIAEMHIIAPFRYAGLVAAIIFGWLSYQEIPNEMGWLGMGLLVVAGLLSLREPSHIHNKTPSA